MSNARFSIVQSRAVRDNRISDAQFRTLSTLGMYADEDGWCFPKLSTLSKDIGKSKQAISRDISALCKLGYVVKRAQFRDDGSQKHNLYRLVFDNIQEIVDGGKPHVDGGSTSEVDGGSTSEVDALTTHINDPIESVYDEGIIIQEEVIGKLFSLGWTPGSTQLELLIEYVNEWEKRRTALVIEHPDKKVPAAEWVASAIKICEGRGLYHNWDYLFGILKKQVVMGMNVPAASNGRKPAYKKPKQTPEEYEAELAERRRQSAERWEQ